MYQIRLTIRGTTIFQTLDKEKAIAKLKTFAKGSVGLYRNGIRFA